jgi:hypothetical protein
MHGKGFDDGITVQNICERAEVRRTTFYAHFIVVVFMLGAIGISNF